MQTRIARAVLGGVIGFSVIAIFLGLDWANRALGETRGIIDHGVWYEMQGHGAVYFEKGIDADNQFLSADSAYRMISRVPDFRRLVRGKYGALVDHRGWLGNATLSTVPWTLFDSEKEAEDYLVERGVPPQNIYRAFR